MPNMLQLDAIFKSLHDAVVNATDVARDSNIEDIKHDYFEEFEEAGNKPGGAPVKRYRPRTLNLLLPVFENGTKAERLFEVPLYSLAKQQALCLDELSIQLHIDLHGLDGPHTLASTSGGQKGTSALVEMKFKAAAPPEGVMRINDHLVKALP